MERFVEWLDAARSSGVMRRMWLYGSFPSAKPGPGDLDMVVLVTADFRLANLPAELQAFFEPEFCHEVLSIDLYLYAERVPDHYLDDLLVFFRKDRSGQETMVEVVL